jgi:hypothetical protein
VRAGDIVSVAVLANDYSPDQELISLDPQLVDTSADGGGLAFVNADTVRYEAPEKAGQYSVVYRIADQYGEAATARVVFTVTPKDPANDQAPVPVTQTARTFSGATVRINVPLDGIDPDGDSVVLAGVVQAPTLGSIVASGPTWFDYKAFTSSVGTDKFKYAVKDQFGATGTGEIDVGVIPRSAFSAQPVAVEDNVEVKPGKTVSAQVLLNDSDPNLYPLTLEKKLLAVSPDLNATVVGSKIIITAPQKQGEYSLRYEINNGQGGTANTFVTVKVTSLAPAVYPTATDDYLLDSQLHGTKPITVNVESLINNPNGLDSALVITAEGPNASQAHINQLAGTISVTPGNDRYAVAYRVTDPTDKTLTATAFIVVPQSSTGKNVGPPHIKYGLAKQIVPQDGSRTWKLSDIVTAPSGKPTIIVDPSTVTATNSDGTSAYVDKGTIRFAAAKGYRGTASVTFQVTDGTSAFDTHGIKALLTLNITVGDPNSDDVAPTFTLLKEPVQAGETAIKIDLQDSTADPNRSLIADFNYGGLNGTTADIAAGLSGSILTISAPLGVQPGATANLTFTITYKQFVVKGEVDVTVVKSTRALTQAVEDDQKGQRGKVSSMNVLTNDINPYADQDKPLTLVAASVENSAQTSATVSFTPDGVVTVHPDASFIGVVSVVYTVEDASKDPSRNVQGRYLLTVRDVPDKPNAPTIPAGGEADGAVTIQWQAPATNGEPILDYTITTSGGIAQKTVSADTASTTIGGLTNGNAYTFQISARNALGDSAISASSAAGIPFGAPSAPSSASISASSTGDGTLSLSWAAANGNGRQISGYDWSISGTGASPASGHINGQGTSATATGVVGTSYKFTVTATNGGNRTGPAQTSNSAIPGIGKPSVSLSAPGGDGDYTLKGSWGNAAANGAGTVTYAWSLSGITSGSTQGNGSTQQTGTASKSYTLTVTASVNGVSSSSSASATTPGPVVVQNPGATIQGRGANHTCSDGSSDCTPAIFTPTNIQNGTYTVIIQTLSGSTVVLSSTTHTMTLQNNVQTQTQAWVGDPGAGKSLRLHIYGGPSGDFYSDTVSRNTWVGWAH